MNRQNKSENKSIRFFFLLITKLWMVMYCSFHKNMNTVFSNCFPILNCIINVKKTQCGQISKLSAKFCRQIKPYSDTWITIYTEVNFKPVCQHSEFVWSNLTQWKKFHTHENRSRRFLLQLLDFTRSILPNNGKCDCIEALYNTASFFL